MGIKRLMHRMFGSIFHSADRLADLTIHELGVHRHHTLSQSDAQCLQAFINFMETRDALDFDMRRESRCFVGQLFDWRQQMHGTPPIATNPSSYYTTGEFKKDISAFFGMDRPSDENALYHGFEKHPGLLINLKQSHYFTKAWMIGVMRYYLRTGRIVMLIPNFPHAEATG